MSTGISEFIYPPIDSTRGEIRILIVSPGTQGDDLGLSFQVLSVHDDPIGEFDAVSYRWGVPTEPLPVTIDGQPFHLTDSQKGMIEDLRYEDRNRRIWIDAICINQKDLVERGQQVQLMRLLYSKAHCVSIWIDHELQTNSYVYQQFLKTRDFSEIIEMLERDNTLWAPICEIFQNEYFNRVWVQQEISNSSRLSLQCKNTVLPSASLLALLSAWVLLRDKFHKNDAPFPEECCFFQYRLPDKLFNKLCGEQSMFGQKPMDLVSVLCTSKRWSCTDQRDLVYGLMHLSHDWQQGDLNVDYTLSLPEVYRQAMVACVGVYGTLRFLEHANFFDADDQMFEDIIPSWVPDFRKKFISEPSEDAHKETNLRQDYSHLARFSGNFLHTHGVKIAEIERCFDTWSKSDNIFEITTHEFARSFNEIIQLAKRPEVSEERTRTLIWMMTQTTKASPLALGDKNFIEAANLFANLVVHSLTEPVGEDFSHTLGNLLWITGSQDNLGNSSYYDPDRSEEEDKLAEVGTMLASLSWYAAEKLAPYICTAGSIGLGSLEARPGDEVWLIPTCPRPIVLRPDDGGYLVVGRAWYHDDDPWCRIPGGFDGCGEAFMDARTEICLK
jgi:hypothetical protein